jgi:heme A synthase
MISKVIIGSYTVTLASIMEAIQEHHLLAFLLVYTLHLFANSFFSRYQTTSPLKHRTPAPLRNWAESQRSTSFTSF